MTITALASVLIAMNGTSGASIDPTGWSSTLPAGVVNQSYNGSVVATSDIPAPITYMHTGGQLPPSLELNTDGTITGVPNTAGTFEFTVTANDGGTPDDETFSITINAAIPSITTTDLGTLTIGTPVNTTVTATGAPTITFSVTAGLLPTGLTLSPSGELAGTPGPLTAGGYDFTVTATNGAGSDAQQFTGLIEEGAEPPVINTAVGPFVVGTAVNQTLPATGLVPLTFGIGAGALPAGLSLSPEGQLTGTPTTPGAYDFTVLVTNLHGSDTQQFTGTVSAQPPTITTDALPTLQVGQPVNVTLEATGTPPITFSVSAGTLPDGLALSEAGVLTGSPTTDGTYDFTVTASNGAPPNATKQFTRPIVPAPGALDLESQLLPGTDLAGAGEISASFSDLLPGSSASLTVTSDPVVIDTDTVDGSGSVTLSGPLPANLPPGAHSVTMDGTSAAGTPVSRAAYFSVQANGTIGEVSNTQQIGDLGFVGLTPVRLLDTRDGGQRLGPDAVLELVVRGVAGIPDDATHVAINLTATDATEPAYVTVYACDQAQPFASNINLVPGETVANAVTSAVSADGKVCLFAAGNTHVIVDVNGAYSPTQGTGLLKGLTPARLLDTRETGPRLTGGTPKAVKVTGAGGISATATSVVLNVTIVSPDAGGFGTVFPCGEEPPWASNINFVPGQIVANMAISKVGTNGEVCILSSSATDLVVDVVAEFDPANTNGHILPTTVSRQFDSREVGAGAMVAGGTFVEVPITGIPVGTTAVALNVTAVSGVADGYVTVYPCGITTPFTSNINFTTGQIRANSTIVPLGTDGKVCVFTTTTTHLVVDLNGAFGPEPVG